MKVKRLVLAGTAVTATLLSSTYGIAADTSTVGSEKVKQADDSESFGAESRSPGRRESRRHGGFVRSLVAAQIVLPSTREGRFGVPLFYCRSASGTESTHKGSTRSVDLNYLRFLHGIFIPPQCKVPGLQ